MIPRFRAWDSVEKKFVEHFFITDNSLICNMEKPTSDRKLPIPIEKSEMILMQSTGLKDKNDKEIFEGDIVKCSGLLGTIELFKAMWICSFVKYNNYQKVGFFAQEIEVVGNIYENPELLEEKE